MDRKRNKKEKNIYVNKVTNKICQEEMGTITDYNFLLGIMYRPKHAQTRQFRQGHDASTANCKKYIYTDLW